MGLRRFFAMTAVALFAALIPGTTSARVIIQYFETPWAEIERRVPEIAAAGYDALWLPPPQKGAEGFADVGFSVYDRFDFGDIDQRGTVRTRYGNRAELLSMIDAAHRHGIRVIFDAVMNHNGNPELIENAGVNLPLVGLDGFPDTNVLDYHVVPARPIEAGNYEIRVPNGLGGGTTQLVIGTYENPESVILATPMPSDMEPMFPGWPALVRAPRIVFDGSTSTFELQSYSLLGLADFALDMDGNNATLDVPLFSTVRQPDCAACYPDDTPRSESIIEYVLRWIAWLGGVTEADGFRLDAVRHVSTQFFDRFNQVVQDEYDARHGFTDDDDKDGIDDAQLFGESFTGDIFGELADYNRTGMQMLNFPLFFTMSGLFSAGSNGNGDLGQLSAPQGGANGGLNEFGGLGRYAGVSFAQSHDSPAPDGQPTLAHAFLLTRIGDSVVFFDGNNPDARSFVKPGRPDALGELGNTITDLVHVHNHFARGSMWNRFVDDDVYAYERVTANGPTLLVILCDNRGAEGRIKDGVAQFGEFDARPLLVTAFPPGTVLVDVTGLSPQHEITVLAPTAVSQEARDRALTGYERSSDVPPPENYGLVYASVRADGDQGYAMYAPRVPQGPKNGSRPLAIWQADQRVEDAALKTTDEKHTAGGARLAPRVLSVARVTGNTISVHVRTDASATAVYLTLDRGGSRLGDADVVTGSPEGIFDGSVEMHEMETAPDGDRKWKLGPLDVTTLAEGTHILRARAFRIAEGGAPIWNTFSSPFVIDRIADDGITLEPLDRDGDDVTASEDDCPNAYDPEQADFDTDGVGDLCDLCPLDGPADLLDGDGCRALGGPQLDALEAIILAALAGDADIADVVRTVNEVNR